MSQQNHNIDYIHTVDGLTVWERLRVIRNFLMDRKIAFQLAQIPVDLESMSEREKQEYEIYRPQLEQNIKNAADEIKFLEAFEARLAVEAEKTRIPGKTDDEMYEINFIEESIQRDLLEMRSQIVSCGRLETSMVTKLLRNEMLFNRAVEQNLLPDNVRQFIHDDQFLTPLLRQETTKCISGS